MELVVLCSEVETRKTGTLCLTDNGICSANQLEDKFCLPTTLRTLGRIPKLPSLQYQRSHAFGQSRAFATFELSLCTPTCHRMSLGIVDLYLSANLVQLHSRQGLRNVWLGCPHPSISTCLRALFDVVPSSKLSCYSSFLALGRKTSKSTDAVMPRISR